MKSIVSNIYFYLYQKAIEREEPETPRMRIIKELIDNFIRYYKYIKL